MAMALQSVRRLIAVTAQKLVPLGRLGIRSFRWTFHFLNPLSWFVSSASVSALQWKSEVFTYPPAMEIRGRIIVYSILGCPHCMRAKNMLMELGLPYQDVRLDMYPKEVREEVKARTGKSTVPQIFFNDHHIGGNDELQKMVQGDKEKLEKLIEEVKTMPSPEGAPVPPDPSAADEAEGPGDFVCEPDEYSQLVEELKESGLVRDHRQGFKTYKKTFCGREFVDWVVKTKELDRQTALEMGQNLIDSHFGHHVKADEEFRDADVYYRLLEDKETTALNGDSISQCEPRKANQLGEDLRKLILKLYSAFLSPDGKAVDYKGIANSEEFRKQYIPLARELQRVNLQGASREEKLAFFVNIYNALVIHANIERGPAVNLWQRYKFFNTVKYLIGGHEYSLQDIENGVLRANRKGVGMFTRPFSKSDPRLPIALETHEPLIHFGLVCGAKSCPPIKTYTADEVISQLSTAAEAFLDGPDGCEVDMEKRTVRLSMILKWYRQDFGTNDEEVVYWVFKHMQNGDQKKHLGQLLESRKFKVSYMKYDWSVNSK